MLIHGTRSSLISLCIGCNAPPPQTKEVAQKTAEEIAAEAKIKLEEATRRREKLKLELEQRRKQEEAQKAAMMARLKEQRAKREQEEAKLKEAIKTVRSYPFTVVLCSTYQHTFLSA